MGQRDKSRLKERLNDLSSVTLIKRLQSYWQ